MTTAVHAADRPTMSIPRGHLHVPSQPSLAQPTIHKLAVFFETPALLDHVQCYIKS
ncbi:hypothetical protein E2C01_078584 [Portunus trituberculatus]|uniref:Uncharacterized protein n=1 Tax=Portunus trituberculatus TaxID=210409 RepID=A0A5B7IUI2_PORTR|nr:hypothetical protein [Portunus trituberculatus]